MIICRIQLESDPVLHRRVVPFFRFDEGIAGGRKPLCASDFHRVVSEPDRTGQNNHPDPDNYPALHVPLILKSCLGLPTLISKSQGTAAQYFRIDGPGES